ncbi:uncharacterized protein LOC129949486 [Eupeodes corollae]|uniref:uncharacterized protein LOC129949486 n=1 Tax=Eupeodes corollae TaxID=290404 RepID=UPI0024936339|nr:uncharacterized protein LOC129949486 [Eupeodes corollae]
MDDNYRFLSQKERSEIAMKITNKWRNLRDVFIRSIKKRATGTKMRKYMYHDRLSFMLKLYKSYIRPESPDDLIQSDEYNNRYLKSCYENRDQRSISFDNIPESPHSLHEKPIIFDSNNEESFSVKTEPEDDDEEEENGIKEVRNGGTEECSSSNDIVNDFDDDMNANRASCSGMKVKENQLQNHEEIKPLDLEFSQFGSGKNLTDDEAFFISVLPTLGDMNLDEKLEFRIAVLQKISDIKSKRLNS